MADLGQVGEDPQGHDGQHIEGEGVGGRPGARTVVVAVRVAHGSEPGGVRGRG